MQDEALNDRALAEIFDAIWQDEKQKHKI